MTPEEKRAYNREYYQRYRKKGVKKGRKKTNKTNLVGLSTGGLNDTGRMQWAMKKEQLTSEMNSALSNASSDEEKAKIRAEYQNKALQALQSMKSNSSFARAKSSSTRSNATKSTPSAGRSTSSTRGSTSSSKGRSSRSRTTSNDLSEKVVRSSIGNVGSSSISQSIGSSKSGGGIRITSRTGSRRSSSSTNKSSTHEMLSQIQSQLDEIRSKLDSLTTEQRNEMRSQIESVVDDLRSRMENKLTQDRLMQEKTGEIHGLRTRLHEQRDIGTST